MMTTKTSTTTPTRQRGIGEPITGDAALAPLRRHRHPRLARICFDLPEVTADSATGQHIAFRVRGKTFAYYLDNHHDDGRIAVACKVPPLAQSELVELDPVRCFVPPYLGYNGWIGYRLDVGGVDWSDVAELVTGSYRLIAPKRLVALVPG